MSLSGRSIAAAQTVPVRGDVNVNVEQHVRLAEAAAAEQVRVVVFPELSLTGYELDLAADLAFAEADPRLAPLVDLAASRSMTLIVGAPVRLEAPREDESAVISGDPRLHIGAFIIEPDGAIEIYTKHHLGAFGEHARRDGSVPPAERTVFHPGTRNPLVRFGAHTGAVAVCADTGRPSHPRHAAERGARTYFASMFIIPSEFEREAASLRAYAIEHRLAVALANYGGPSGGLRSAGGTSIWSESGDLLARLGETGPGLAVAIEGTNGWHARTVRLDQVRC